MNAGCAAGNSSFWPGDAVEAEAGVAADEARGDSSPVDRLPGDGEEVAHVGAGGDDGVLPIAFGDGVERRVLVVLGRRAHLVEALEEDVTAAVPDDDRAPVVERGDVGLILGPLLTTLT